MQSAVHLNASPWLTRVHSLWRASTLEFSDFSDKNTGYRDVAGLWKSPPCWKSHRRCIGTLRYKVVWCYCATRFLCRSLSESTHESAVRLYDCVNKVLGFIEKVFEILKPGSCKSFGGLSSIVAGVFEKKWNKIF